MRTQVIKHRYQLKRGTEATIDAENPLLLKGEPIVVYREDGGVGLKVGDGVTHYRDLVWAVRNDISIEVIDELTKDIKAIEDTVDNLSRHICAWEEM